MKLASKIFRRTDWYVTSAFGWRADPFTGQTSGHSGTDYGTNVQKWPQYAIESGTILSCGIDRNGYNALYVWVSYPSLGKKFLHYHLDSISVSSGQHVQEGTLLGYTGTTGRSTAIHLHLGMQPSGGGSYQDPHAYEYYGPVEFITPPPALGPCPFAEPADVLQKGGQGDGVKWIQWHLNQKGVTPQLAVDGSFGPATDAAVCSFQSQNDLVVDGRVGPLTRGKLKA
ncbi:MAG: peptidoglycan-binding protein [Peptococcaceae bacterium]|nr:peptidoglycan-binding protein [Peptococcaceae bacterium]